MQSNVLRILVLAAAVVALGLSIAACGGGGSSSTSEAGGSSTSEAATPAGSEAEGSSGSSEGTAKDASAAEAEGTKAGEAAGGKKLTTLEPKTIGFLALTQQAAAVKRATEGFEEAVKALGWKVIVCEGNAEPQKLAACGSSLVAQNVDAIAEVAVEPSVVHQAMAEAQSKGIPWIDFGSQNTPNPLFTSRMYITEKELFEPVNGWLFENLEEPGEIGALTAESLSPTRLRYAAFQEELEQHPEDKIVGTFDIPYTDPSKVTEGVEAMIRQHSGIGAIWSSGDVGVIPTVEAFKQLGLSATEHPLLVSTYPEANVLQDIREGWVSAEVDMPFNIWSYIITDELAQLYSHEKELSKDGKPAGYPAKMLEPVLVTKENVTQEANAFQPFDYDYTAYFDAKWKAEFSNANGSN